MKRLLSVITVLFLLVGMFTPVTAEDDFSDTTYWTNLCTGAGGVSLTIAQKKSCAAFMNYMKSQSKDLEKALEDVDAKMKDAAAELARLGREVQNYQAQVYQLNQTIAMYNGQIAVKEQEIERLEGEIADSEAQIDAAEEKIKERMVMAQETMRLNPYLDILMGARSFNDFIRITNGLSDITAYDEKTMQDLQVLIEKLNNDKIQVEKEKEDIEALKVEVVAKQAEVLALLYQVQLLEEEQYRQYAELQAQGNKIASNIDAIKSTMESIQEKLNEVVAAGGWTYPVAGGHINPNAGTWHYYSGALHLGADFVGSRGTPVVAAGNGVILHSTDGCDDGYIGNGCTYGGAWGGGNQVFALFKINGGLYGMSYSHLLKGTTIAAGTVVKAGDIIASLGTSGNSSGPHCHIEVYYLGSADNFASYAANWNGDLAFNAGWGVTGYNLRCEAGNSAPCRVRPETVFGG